MTMIEKFNAPNAMVDAWAKRFEGYKKVLAAGESIAHLWEMRPEPPFDPETVCMGGIINDYRNLMAAIDPNNPKHVEHWKDLFQTVKKHETSQHYEARELLLDAYWSLPEGSLLLSVFEDAYKTYTEEFTEKDDELAYKFSLKDITRMAWDIMESKNSAFPNTVLQSFMNFLDKMAEKDPARACTRAAQWFYDRCTQAGQWEPALQKTTELFDKAIEADPEKALVVAAYIMDEMDFGRLKRNETYPLHTALAGQLVEHASELSKQGKIYLAERAITIMTSFTDEHPINDLRVQILDDAMASGQYVAAIHASWGITEFLGNTEEEMEAAEKTRTLAIQKLREEVGDIFNPGPNEANPQSYRDPKPGIGEKRALERA